MMPAFHREQIEASVRVMAAEAERALARWSPGETVDVYHWMRELAMRIAMRALLGLDPDDGEAGSRAAHHFERALGYFGTGPFGRMARGPGTPWWRMRRSRKVLDEIVYGEIAARRARPDPERLDVLSLLISAQDEEGNRLTDEEIRDQAMTLMFAGHDTSTSTVSFLMYQLARNPDVAERLAADNEEVLGGAAPGPAQLHGELPYLEQVMDETLRLYPPAWIGPRRNIEAFDFAGHHVPADTYVAYSSWASHRLPEVFPDPDRFDPERFTRERKAALPHGAYVPFGAGRRICIGKRFGQTEVKLVTTMILQRFRLSLAPGYELQIRDMPTIGPAGGLPMVARAI
jgi:cytochrome P450